MNHLIANPFYDSVHKFLRNSRATKQWLTECQAPTGWCFGLAHLNNPISDKQHPLIAHVLCVYTDPCVWFHSCSILAPGQPKMSFTASEEPISILLFSPTSKPQFSAFTLTAVIVTVWMCQNPKAHDSILNSGLPCPWSPCRGHFLLCWLILLLQSRASCSPALMPLGLPAPSHTPTCYFLNLTTQLSEPFLLGRYSSVPLHLKTNKIS